MILVFLVSSDLDEFKPCSSFKVLSAERPQEFLDLLVFQYSLLQIQELLGIWRYFIVSPTEVEVVYNWNYLAEFLEALRVFLQALRQLLCYFFPNSHVVIALNKREVYSNQGSFQIRIQWNPTIEVENIVKVFVEYIVLLVLQLYQVNRKRLQNFSLSLLVLREEILQMIWQLDNCWFLSFFPESEFFTVNLYYFLKHGDC